MWKTSYLLSMVRNLTILLVCLSWAWSAKAQEVITWKQAKVVHQPAVDVRLDQLNNLYAVQRGEVIKMDPAGKVLARYSNKLIGEKAELDVSNPMKVLVFSDEQMKLIFLDSRLAEMREEINLYNEGYEQISLAATSHSNGFWLYDPIEFKLIRYDQYFKKERESLNMAQLLRVAFYPVDLLEVDNRVYLSDPKHGVYVFDVFGTFLRRIPLKGVSRLKIADSRLFFMRDEQLFAFHLVDGTEEMVSVVGEIGERFDMNRARLCSVSQKGIIIFEPNR